jgi:hypothetical protein
MGLSSFRTYLCDGVADWPWSGAGVGDQKTRNAKPEISVCRLGAGIVSRVSKACHFFAIGWAEGRNGEEFGLADRFSQFAAQDLS